MTKIIKSARVRSKHRALGVIAFDLGATFAWAAYVPGGGYDWGHRILTGPRPERLAAFAAFLRSKDLPKADVVLYETPFTRGRDATRSLWGMAGVLEAAATEASLPVIDVAVATIKKYATGHGHAPKNSMIMAARKLGYEGNNEHEADAYCLVKYGIDNLEVAP